MFRDASRIATRKASASEIVKVHLAVSTVVAAK